MNSVQTKETPNALAGLLKAKGQRPSGTVQTPVATVVENSHTSVTATPELPPEPKDDLVLDTAVKKPEQPEDGRGDYKESYTNLKAHHDKITYELRTKVKELETDLSQARIKKVESPKTKEEIEAFKTSNRDAFDIMRTIVIDELSSDGAITDTKKRLDDLNTTIAQIQEKEAFKRLLEEHPDALEIRNSSQFALWFNEQPDDIKRILAASTDVKAVAKQLTLYKLENNIVTTKDKKKAEAKQREEDSLAVPLQSRAEINPQKKRWTKTEIDRVCSDYKLWNKYRVEIDEARRDGRVDMDK